MLGSIRLHRRALRSAFLVTAALCAAPFAAFADDRPATPEGAQGLDALFATYLGANAATAAPAGDHYDVTIDLARMMAPLSAIGVSAEPSPAPAHFTLTEQGDGAWRVARDGDLAMTFRVRDSRYQAAIEGYKLDGVFDPAIAGFRSLQAGVDKQTVHMVSPEFEETSVTGPLRMTGSGAAAQGGGLSGAVRQEGGDASVVIAAVKPGDAAKPPPTTFRYSGAAFEATFDNFRSHETLDLWRFLVAHPSRAELAANEAALKDRLRALLPIADKLSEAVSLEKMSIDTPMGAAEVDGLRFSIAAEGVPSDRDAEIHLAFEKLVLPANLTRAAADFAPTSMDLGVRFGGVDFRGAVEEAIDDFHLAGDGPIFTDADRAKVDSLIARSGSILVTLLPSHVVAPQLDLSLHGDFEMTSGGSTGKLIVTARNFERMMAAVRSNPAAAPEMLATLTMAQGLGKPDADGALTWIAEYGADGTVKVNGQPLGKTP
jgi:hypothetical protein